MICKNERGGTRVNQIQVFSKAFLLIFICTVFIALFSYGGAFAMETIFPKKFFYPPGTMIASVAIGGLTDEEAEVKLINELEIWRNNTSFRLVYFDEIVEIEAAEVEFFIAESLQLVEKGYGELYANLPEHLFFEAIEAFSYPIPIAELNQEALKKRVRSHIVSLSPSPVYININEYIDTKTNETEVVATAQISNLENSPQLSEWSSMLDGLVIEAEERFSLLDTMKAIEVLPTGGESLNSLATVLYQLFLETNFQIVERHSSLTLPSHTLVGLNAVLLPNKADLIVENKNYYPYTLKLSFQSNELKASLTGLTFPYQYTAIIKDQRVIEPRKIVHFSATRRIGDKQVIKNGEKGYFAEVYRQVKNHETEQLLHEQFLFEDFYPPVHQIEEWSFKERPIEKKELKEDDVIAENDERPSDIETDDETTGGITDEVPDENSDKQDELQNDEEPESIEISEGETKGY